MLMWRAAFRFPTHEAGSISKLGQGGLWLLLCPPVGWLMALGYRREVGLRLVEGVFPVLPAWRDLRLATLGHGAKALGVILAYFTPFLTLYWVLALDSLSGAVERWREIGLFFLILPCFVPLTMPGLLLVYPRWYPWMSFSASDVVVLATLFAATTFLLPGAFMQVSLYRRFRLALRIDRVVRLIASAPGAYVEAWAISLTATVGALLGGPLLPWSIPWSYLVIGFAFNNALALSTHPAVTERFAGSKLLGTSILAAPNPALHLTAAASGLSEVQCLTDRRGR
jgi:hypothetical protein